MCVFNMLFLCVLAVVFGNFVSGEVNCAVTPDGMYEVTCYQFIQCENGSNIMHNCTNGQMYHPDTALCDNPANVPPPCSLMRNCMGLPDKSYADVEYKCNSYYTCYNHLFYGHTFCPPGLVFDESIQVCNWPFAVAPPCGGHSPVVG